MLNAAKREEIRELAQGVVQNHFLELFDLVVRPQGSKLIVTLVLDKKLGEITVDECARVSRDFEKRLDEMDGIESSYLLEVSSPGMDRPLRNLEDCRRFQGRLAKFVFLEPLEGVTTFRGRLGEVKEEKVEVIEGQKIIWVAFQAVKHAQLIVEI